MIRFYVLPIEQVGIYRGPKYFHWRYDPDPPGIDCVWSMKDYGNVNECVIAADLTAADDTALRSNGDVYGFPENMDANMPASERNKLSAVLDAAFVPRHWITSSTTYRQALRAITSMFLYMQRLTYLGGNPFEWGISLNTRWSELSAQQKDWITQAAWDLGYTIDFIVANSTIRQILKGMADQWGARVILFGFVEL
jgi:hypothetical protein